LAALKDQRQLATSRHKSTLDRIISFLSPEIETIVLFGHGSTADFITEALTPHQHLTKYYSPYCVLHTSFTTFILNHNNWNLYQFGSQELLLLAPEWNSVFSWIKHQDKDRIGNEWIVNELSRITNNEIQKITIITPHSFHVPQWNHVYILDPNTKRVKVWDGNGTFYEAVSQKKNASKQCH